MPKMVLFVCLSCLVQKLLLISRLWQNSRWPPIWPPKKHHGPRVELANNMYDFLDILRILKMYVRKIECFGDRGPPFLLD